MMFLPSLCTAGSLFNNCLMFAAQAKNNIEAPTVCNSLIISVTSSIDVHVMFFCQLNTNYRDHDPDKTV